jgi:hypothetical protein
MHARFRSCVFSKRGRVRPTCENTQSANDMRTGQKLRIHCINAQVPDGWIRAAG